MKLSKELNKKEKEIYIKICTSIWGCVPVDVLWATESKPYQFKQLNIIEISKIMFEDTKPIDGIYLDALELASQKSRKKYLP